jgi:hypothetical protein
MDVYCLTLITGLLAMTLLSALAARAEERLWSKARHRESRLRAQQQITGGKSHCR